jgi:hypothetical protein
MDTLEFSVGFGGWCAVLWLVILVGTDSFHPFLAVLVPIITITATLLVLVIVRNCFLALLWILSKMFTTTVISTVVPVFMLGLTIFVILDILSKIKEAQNLDLPVNDDQLHIE